MEIQFFQTKIEFALGISAVRQLNNNEKLFDM
jgi:hypothetical protein